MSTTPVNQPPSTYKHPETALKIKMGTPDEVARSLQKINADPSLQGKKILFYKHGENYYAVPNEDRPAFWHRQFFKCFYKDEQLEYANTEVGQKLASHFGKSGLDLQSKMKWGFWKQAVATEEFLPAVTHNLSEYAKNLNSALEDKWGKAFNSSDEEIPERSEALEGKLASLVGKSKELETAVDQGGLSVEGLNAARQEIAEIQADFWDELAQRLDVSEDPTRSTEKIGNLPDELARLGVSDANRRTIYFAGLLNARTVFTLEHWIDPGAAQQFVGGLAVNEPTLKTDYLQVLARKGGEHQQLVDNVHSDICAARAKISAAQVGAHLPSELHRRALLFGLEGQSSKHVAIGFGGNQRTPSAMHAELADISRECGRLTGLLKNTESDEDFDTEGLNEAVRGYFQGRQNKLHNQLREVNGLIEGAEISDEPNHYLSSKSGREVLLDLSAGLNGELSNVNPDSAEHEQTEQQLETLTKSISDFDTLARKANPDEEGNQLMAGYARNYFETVGEDILGRFNSLQEILDGQVHNKYLIGDRQTAARIEVNALVEELSFLMEELKDESVLVGGNDEFSAWLEQLDDAATMWGDYVDGKEGLDEGPLKAAVARYKLLTHINSNVDVGAPESDDAGLQGAPDKALSPTVRPSRSLFDSVQRALGDELLAKDAREVKTKLAREMKQWIGDLKTDKDVAEIGDIEISRKDLTDIRNSVKSGNVRDPRIVNVLAEHLDRQVTLLQFDPENEDGEVVRHEDTTGEPPMIYLAMYGNQFHNVEPRPT